MRCFPLICLATVMFALIPATPAAAGIADWSPTASIQINRPQKLSISIGVSTAGIMSLPLFGPESGFLLRLEPGLSGSKLHVGTRSIFNMLFLPVVSVDITASLLYTYNSPWGDLENDQTYMGLESRFGAHLLLVTAGMYRHIGGGDSEHDWHFSAGAGIGF